MVNEVCEMNALQAPATTSYSYSSLSVRVTSATGSTWEIFGNGHGACNDDYEICDIKTIHLGDDP